MNALKLNQAVVIGDEIALAWSDGVESYLGLETLRRACPCAACQGEPDVTGKILVPKVSYQERSFRLVRHEVVGSYALQLFWGDGHHSGLYSFEMLRAF
jgi:DUF971 family protein